MDKKWVKIPDVLFFQEGPGVRNTQYTNEGVKLLNVANLVDGKVDLSTSDRYISEEEAFGKYSHFLCNDGDFIVASSGIKVEYIDKKMGFVDETMLPLCMNTSTIRFKVLNPNELRIRYFMYYLKSQHFKGQLFRLITGSAQLNYGPSHLKQMDMPLIKVSEQDKIVRNLDILQKIIDLRQNELNKFDELIKARFVEMFGNIHEDRFPKCKLRDVAHIKHGYAFSGEYFSDDDNGVVLVTPGNFALGGGFQEVRNRYFTSDYPDEYVLHAGDLIVTMTDLSKKVDTLGYGAIVPNSDKVYLHNQRIGLFDKLDSMLNPVFVRWFMQTDEYRLEIVRTSTGSTVHHTSPDRILDTVIYLPPIEMQNKFVSFAEQVDKSKVVVQKSLEENQLLFDSLMQKYFG